MRLNGCRQRCEMPLLSPSCQTVSDATRSSAVCPSPSVWQKRHLERLEYQIKYLTEWHERLSGIHKSVLLCPERPKNKNEVVPLRGNLATQRRAS